MTFVRMAKRTSVFGMSAFLFACGGGDAGDAADTPAQDATPEAPAAEPAAQEGAGLDLSNVALPDGVTAEMVNRGAEFYPNQVCTACHGPDASGSPLGPNLTDAEWLNSDGTFEAIVGTIMDGVAEPQQFPGVMLPKGGMSTITDDQVRDLAAFIFARANGAM